MPEMTDDVVELPEEVSTYIDELEKANRELSDRLTEELVKSADAAADELDEDDDLDDEMESALEKADPAVKALIEKQQAILDQVTGRMAAAEEIAKAERDARLTREFISKAADYEALPGVTADGFGLFLKSASEKLDEQEFGVLTQVLDGASELAKSSVAFTEVGATGAGAPSSDIEKAAAKLMAENPSLNKFEAIAKAVDLDPTLWQKEA
jgi:hypothetical protein